MNKTFLINKKDLDCKWYLIDAKGKRLGRISTKISNILRGKNKPIFSPHIDAGDFVIIINASEVVISGNKPVQKLYRRHSGRPGGMKVETFEQVQVRVPGRILETAIRGMLPKGPLGRQVFKK